MNLYTEMNRLEARARELVQQGGSGDIHCQVCTDLANEFNLWHRDMFPTWLCRVVAGIMADGPSPGDPNPTPAEDKDKQVTVFLRGAVFIDPTAEKPYVFHLALVSVVRRADADIPDLATEDVLDCRLVGVKQSEGSEVTLCPVEHLLLLRGGHGLPGAAQRLAMVAEKLRDHANAFLVERVARGMAVERRDALLATLPDREQFIRRGFDFQEAELAAARLAQSEKARTGNKAAQAELAKIKTHQKEIAARKAQALAVVRREPELIAAGGVTFVAHALVVPSTNPDDVAQHDAGGTGISA